MTGLGSSLVGSGPSLQSGLQSGGAAAFPALDPALGLALRLALAALLLSAALHKARDLRGFAGTLAGYALLPAGWSRPVAGALPVAEGAIALALLVPGAVGLPYLSGAASPLAGAALLSLYTAAVAAALARGRRGLPCGCGGPAGPAVLGPALLARNAVLVVLALAAALPPAARPLVWIDAVTVGGSVAALALIHAAVDRLLANGPALRALRARSVRGSDGSQDPTSLRAPSLESAAIPSTASISSTSSTPSGSSPPTSSIPSSIPSTTGAAS